MQVSRSIWIVIVVLIVTAVGLSGALYRFANRVDQMEKKTEVPQQTTAADLKRTAFRNLSYSKALESSGREGKPLLVYFRAKGSGPSLQMEGTTWGASDVQTWLHDRVVAIRVDADEHPDLAVARSIDRLPVCLFLRADGSEIGRVVGYQPPDWFVKESDAVLRTPR